MKHVNTIIAIILLAAGLGSPAFATEMTHTASVSVCPTSRTVHGNCKSVISGGSGQQRLSFVCKLRRYGAVVDDFGYTYHNVPANGTYDSDLNALAFGDAIYCTDNHSEFMWKPVFSDWTRIKPQQAGAQACRNYRAPGSGPGNQN